MRGRVRVVIVGVTLALSGCGGSGLTGVNRELAEADRANTRAALNASRRGDHAAAAQAYVRIFENTGHPAAAMQVARAYATGRGLPKDPALAAHYYEEAVAVPWSERGEAARALADLYARGEGVRQDTARAIELYRLALDEGVAAAALRLARAYEQSGAAAAPGEVAALYRVAAEAGEPEAALRVAELDLKAGAAPADVQVRALAGIAWLEEQARKGKDWAEFRLAQIYEEGRLAPPDPALAERHLRAAAEHGNTKAIVRLAEREEAAGRPEEALAYWRRAAEKGHASGMVRVGRAEIAAGRMADGIAWLERAAAAGHSSAAYELGRRKLRGDGVAKDPAAGLALLEKAAELGHASAMYTLGTLYRDGTSVRKDREMAKAWLERAQDAGHRDAAGALAKL